MKGTGLMPKIARMNAIILIGLMGVAVVALVTGNSQLADTIVGALLGVVLGTGATTIVVQSHAAKDDIGPDGLPKS